jgi:signal transduction histidine kinase/ligand-binding sensor domain-containing protein
MFADWSSSTPRAVPVVRTLLAAALLMVGSQAAVAIDSQRTLTQALLRKWQIQQGLPQPTITVVTQASNGTLWLGTQNGLYQFDGVRFDPALVIEGPSFDDVWINDLCEDSTGRLWIATRGDGLLSLHDGEVVNHGQPVGNLMVRVNCLMLDSQNRLWVGGEGGVAVHYRGTFRRYERTDGLKIPSVRDIVEASDQSIWLGGDGVGLAVWKDGKFNDIAAAAGHVVNAILADSDGAIIAGTHKGLIRLQGGSLVSKVAANNGLPDDNVECLARTRDGVLWAGTRDGLCRLIGDQVETLSTRDGLTQSTVLTICEDQEGSLWAGTKHGLNQLTDRRTLPLTSTEGLPTNNAGPILQDPAGQIWIGTLGGGLAKYDGRQCDVVVDRASGLPSNRLLSLAATKEGGLWIGTDHNICLWQNGEIATRLKSKDGLQSQIANCLALDDSENLWIGTPRGLFRYNGTAVERPFDDPAFRKIAVYVLKNAGPRGIIAATSNGVFLIHEGKATPLPGDENWLCDVQAIEIGPEGEFWLAVRGRGLMLINGNEVAKFTVADGLFDDEIVGIARSNDDKLWMGCSRGIFSMPRIDLLKFAREGGRNSLSYFSLSPTEAQRTVECQRNVQPAVSRTTNGDIWFSTIHGVIVVSPEKLENVFPNPKPDVTRLLVNGQPTSPTHPIVVPPGSLNLSVRYTSHTFTWPTRTTFRYQLEGFDKGWVNAGTRREAFYTNLSPGTYRFRVSAIVPNGQWLDATLPVQITLRAAFWQTPWFPLLIGLFALAMIWLFLRLRVLRVRTHMHAIVAERARIARELHDTLIQGFSGVTMQMQAVSAKVDNPELKTAINGVIADAGACLREARQSVAGLRNSMGTSMGLAAALEQTARQLTETRDVRLQLQLPESTPSLPVEVQFNLLRIAQEAITNATRHANARTIDVALTPKPGRLALRVHDDGVGFSVGDREGTDQRHYGLIGMRERSRQISADLTIESKPGAGTTILVDLPLNGSEQNGAASPPPAYNSSRQP